MLHHLSRLPLCSAHSAGKGNPAAQGSQCISTRVITCSTRVTRSNTWATKRATTRFVGKISLRGQAVSFGSLLVTKDKIVWLRLGTRAVEKAQRIKEKRSQVVRSSSSTREAICYKVWQAMRNFRQGRTHWSHGMLSPSLTMRKNNEKVGFKFRGKTARTQLFESQIPTNLSQKWRILKVKNTRTGATFVTRRR